MSEEREACAKIADTEAERWRVIGESHSKSGDADAASRAAAREHTAKSIAAAIRARQER